MYFAVEGREITLASILMFIVVIFSPTVTYTLSKKIILNKL